MKVLQVCEAYGGGVKKHLDLISKVMSPTVKNYYYISPSLNEEVAIHSENIQVDKNFSNRKNPLHLLNAALKILRTVKKVQPNVIHFHSTFAGIVAVLLKPLVNKNIRFIYTPHAYFSQKDFSPIKRKVICKVEKRILQSMDKVIHVSKQEEQHCFDKNLLLEVEKYKSTVIYNGVEKPNYFKTQKNKDKTVFVNVARCVDQKNPELFVEVAKRYIQLDSRAEFIFVGDGPKFSAIKIDIERSGLSEKIHFIGYSNKVQQYLEQADFYLSTSKYEGMPYSVIEAMAVGLPLILSDVVGHKELISQNGFLYNHKNIQEIIGVLRDISRLSEDRYIKMVNSSIEKFRSNFDAYNNIRLIELLYKDE